MAKIEPILKDDGTTIGKLKISADELLDIRKEALRAAVMIYQGYGNRRACEYLDMAKFFEEHLTRNAGNG